MSAWAATTEEIDKLGRGGDGHIVASGGVRFWRSLMQLDLIDEFRLDLRPYVAGEGTRLFDEVPKPLSNRERYQFAPGVKAKSAERVHDNTPVSNSLELSNAAVRIFTERPMLRLGWTGFRTHSRDYFRQAEDYEMTTSGTGMHNVFLANLVVLGMVGNANLSALSTSFPNTILWLWAGIVWRPRVAPETIPVLEREPERPAVESVWAGVAA